MGRPSKPSPTSTYQILAMMSLLARGFQRRVAGACDAPIGGKSKGPLRYRS
jgi:hypothetical protein